MKRKEYLILVAGGSGTRMGADRPKQFLEIEGKAILHHTIERFLSAVPDIEIITVLPDAFRQLWKDYCYSRNLVCRQTLVSGGITRFHSVRNALARIPDGALAAVHDGVRPFASENLIRSLFDAAENEPAVVPVVPCTDTLKVLEKNSEGNLVQVQGQTADRSRLYAAQTPQIFWSEVLRKAYELPYSPAFTDDASVVERSGVKAGYLQGEKYNLKITTPDDLEMAEILLSLRRLRGISSH